MPDLRENLAKLASSRAADAARKKETRQSLTDFIETRIKSTPAPASPTPVGVTPASVQRRLSTTPSGSGGLAPTFEAALNRLIADSKGRLKLNSGYRSPERQAQLFAAAVKKYGSPEKARHYVAPPGHSKHNEGLAADLGGDLDYAHANASKYGLVFPMSWEKWHIEQAGARK